MSPAEQASVSAVDHALVAAFQSYREGLRPSERTPEPLPVRDFDGLRFLGSVGWGSPRDRLTLHRLEVSCSAGLRAARQGQLEESRQHYDRAEVLLGSLDGQATHRAWLIGASTYEAGVAYLDARHGRWTSACSRLDRAMDADLELEQIGLPVMQMHRIQQGHNLVRVDFRRGNRPQAVRRTGVLLAYLEGRVETLPYHRQWRPRALRAVPRGLRTGMIHQIVGETSGFIVTGGGAPSEWRTLIEASRLLEGPGEDVFPAVRCGLLAVHNRLTGDRERYLLELEKFFRFGILGCHLLWYPLLIELIAFCGELDTPVARKLGAVLLQDSTKWKGVPPRLRDHLGNATVERTVA